MKELRQRIQTVWYQLDLRVINRAVQSVRRTRLRACVV